MKLLVSSFIAILILLTGCSTAEISSTQIPAISPSPTSSLPPHKMVDMNVNGVRLATGYEEAISKLGKPSRTKTVIKDNCGEEKVRIIEYPGLQIEFGLYEEQNRHIAQRFVVTSNLWPIGSDIKIGSRLADVVSVFGTPWNNDYNENTESLGYNVVPGNDVGELAFKKGVLVKAHWYINPC